MKGPSRGLASLAVALCLGLNFISSPSSAQTLAPTWTPTQLRFSNLRPPDPSAPSPYWDCAAPKVKQPVRRSAASVHPKEASLALEIPDAEQVQQAQASEKPDAITTIQTPSPPTWLAALQQKLDQSETVRVGVWGDSHLAANFFTQTLRDLVDPRMNVRVTTRHYAANVGRAGVRLNLRAFCLSQGWQYVLGHQAGTPSLQGPGLVSLLAAGAEAHAVDSMPAAPSVHLDLREKASSQAPSPASPQALSPQVQLLYRANTQPTQLRITINEEAQQAQTIELPVQSQAQPAVLSLDAQGVGIAQLRIEVLRGEWLWHGLVKGSMAGASSPIPTLALDVFAYPGATFEAWTRPQTRYWLDWFNQPWLPQLQYDWVILGYGTNEANDPHFDIQHYAATLRQGLQRLRQALPHAACTLIAPPDRGVLVPRRHGRKSKRAHRLAGLLRFSKRHLLIAHWQAKIGSDFGCTTWSMQASMGGIGSAYAWARAKPPLMARDLIHLTATGYQTLARRFATEHGWIGQQQK